MKIVRNFEDSDFDNLNKIPAQTLSFLSKNTCRCQIVKTASESEYCILVLIEWIELKLIYYNFTVDFYEMFDLFIIDHFDNQKWRLGREVCSGKWRPQI